MGLTFNYGYGQESAMADEVTQEKTSTTKKTQVSVDADTYAQLVKMQGEFEAKIGFKPTLSQTLKLIIKERTDEVK